MDVIFLGVNDIGLRIYEWLCDRDSVNMVALLTEKSQLDLVHDVRPDLLVSVGFDHLVPSDILDVPSQGAINLHPALLPYNRGKSPNVWPLIDGTPAGVTLHYMDESFDTGEIISQRQIETDFADTGKRLHSRLENAQYDLFTEVWPDIQSGRIDTTPQDSEQGSYHTTDDFLDLCEIDPREKVQTKEFLDRLRALTFPPFNNAYLEIDGERYYVDIEIRKASNEDSEKISGLLSSY
jgi:methionyl-tRNA formyltransferase